eukprot:CAMPEP_0183571848 /NCGR_PEP_ID=MMETSP0371-20130417/127095_1 /TAXON_ID=268820 /ORGANISM="Peridinium aciculiferum, Strain PAER-2" /LENGTH=101 /DNA_ID=CAMNT_0025781647 /DNA_START=66 /DNA_END=369 /DNA_ORIENTATION=+
MAIAEPLRSVDNTPKAPRLEPAPPPSWVTLMPHLSLPPTGFCDKMPLRPELATFEMFIGHDCLSTTIALAWPRETAPSDGDSIEPFAVELVPAAVTSCKTS